MSLRLSYIEDSPIFHCRRVRSADDDSDNTAPPERTASGNGALSYSMDIEPGVPGGTTEVTMTPNFNFPGISARIISCRVSSGEHEIYPIHSFHSINDACFDATRKRFLKIFTDRTIFSLSCEASVFLS